MLQLGRDQARRIALAAQGFGVPRPDRPVTIRDVQSVVSRLGQFQIDSINIVARAHYLPLFSRLGAYDVGLLDRAAHTAPRRLFEYWGHAASLIDVKLQPYLRFRMQAAYRTVWGGVERAAQENPELLPQLVADVGRLGPVSARGLEVAEERDRTSWGWNWSMTKTLLEWLFYVGDITSARRNKAFEREYDLPERVLPPAVLVQPTPSPRDSVRALVRVAARALGVASESCLRDYFRTRSDMTRAAIAELVASGELVPVEIEGWHRQTYLWHGVDAKDRARRPRSLRARALVSPFDSVMFERERLHRLFDFFYRIEIYVPEAKRLHGYYVYPFLLGDRFVARVDLKADRAAGRLRVNAAWIEPAADVAEVAPELAAELTELAGWLGLSEVEVRRRGDLGETLARFVA